MSRHGQLVTLVHGCKSVAEGSIIGHHIGYLDVIMDDEGRTKRINVSATRSLVEISKVHIFIFLIFWVLITFSGSRSGCHSFLAQTNDGMDLLARCKNCRDNFPASNPR